MADTRRDQVPLPSHFGVYFVDSGLFDSIFWVTLGLDTFYR